jgi:hypothetical protein
MMTTNKFFLLLLLCTTISFFSCEDEPVDPEFLVELPNDCDAPTLFTVSSFINGNTVRIDWDKTSGSEWEIQYGNDGFTPGTGTTVNFTATSSLINGLVETTVYDFYIRTKCLNSQYSAWVGPVSPGSISSTCQLPEDVVAIRSTADTSQATVSWSVNGDEITWQLEYGPQGFALGSGISSAGFSPTKTVTGLLENVSYDFYVRSNCSATENSEWVGPINIAAVGAPSTDSFSALVNGFSFLEESINVNPNALHNGFPSINIIAANAADHQIDINIENDVEIGTAYFNNDPLTDKFRFIYFEPVPNEFETVTDGSITITERTATRIKGTFYFNAINPIAPLEIKTITEGSFDVAIP